MVLLQAYMCLSYALAITAKIQENINPLTGDKLGSQTELMVRFWTIQRVKIKTLLALVDFYMIAIAQCIPAVFALGLYQQVL